MNTIRTADFPYRPEVSLTQGTTFIYTFTLKEISEGEAVSAAEPINLTGHDFDATLIVQGKGTEVGTYGIGTGITVATPTNGVVVIRIEASETADFTACCHELRVNWTDNTSPAIVKRILHIKINVTQ